jgi:Lon-like ATP-dependent protease
MGVAGIPQPKPGACTRAHGGILFLDEIGELHPLQLNKLLKVLEDRKVMLDSAYYAETDKNIPEHIHDIFQNGLPADFRLVGATTRMPDELPSALRSRCMEIFFKPLDQKSIRTITLNAADKISLVLEEGALQEIIRHAGNGREAVNIVQLAAGIAQVENKASISQDLVLKVLNNGRFSPRLEPKIKDSPQVGLVNGLAVFGPNIGTLIEVEASAVPVSKGMGTWTVTGVIEEEEISSGGRTSRRKSMACGALENVMTVLKSKFGINIKDYDIHINFPGGTPVDGPSAGVSMATAIYSALNNVKVNNLVAMTGEISVHGQVKPVGGVMSKVEAARNAGIKKVLIPQANWLSLFESFADIEVAPVLDLKEVLQFSIVEEQNQFTV